jgi:primosomal protein N' (replication factor Y)
LSIFEIAEVAVPVPLYPRRRFFDYKIPEHLKLSLRPGHLVSIPFGNRKSWGIIWSLKESSAEKKLKEILELRYPEPVMNETKRDFAEWLSRRYFYPIGEVCESMLPSAIRKASQKLLTKEIVSSSTDSNSKLLNLNEDQKLAYENISQSSQRGHLLWGVTGSGKTEVYLHLIRDCLISQKGAIVLVPEIALTPQLSARFEKAFPGQVAVFHSAQSDKEQREEWLKVFLGYKKIALGPRSALFAPLPSLGLLIVDEEHEGSYKQEERLRYHGRVSAEKLCELMHAKFVLGSATPSAETLKRALSGELSLNKLSRRAVEQAKRPEVILVDLKKNIKEKTFLNPDEFHEKEAFDLAPQSLFFSQELISSIDQTLKANEQAILFLNRRGMGRALVCKSCGHQPTCVQCAVNLVPHRNKLLCHYCGFECMIPSSCEKCQGFLRELGYGTQALEEELKLFFPQAKTVRLDRDIVQDRKKLIETLQIFNEQKANILIGTQMVAKGHDFPQVSLVGIVLADIGFSLPDFRNEERIFQLLIQVAGRAGRSQIPGKVIVQTFRPQEGIFENISRGESLESFEEYLKNVLMTREFLHYPPFSQLTLLQFQGLYEDQVAEAARSVAHAMQKIKKEKFQVLGPVPAPILKVRNKYRYHVLVKAPDEDTLNKAVEWIFQSWEENKLEKKFKGTRLIVDVDPVSLV